MAKLILSDLASLSNEASALAIMAANNTLIEAAIENTLSRDATDPNEMNGPLDMNSQRILNLPSPVSDTEPLRRKDLTDFLGISTVSINAVPVGGSTGQPLAKTGSADFALGWATITGTGSFVKDNAPTITSPTLVTPALGTPSAVNLANATNLPVASLTGQVALAKGGTGANLVDPNADRILFWDDSAGAMTWLTPGTGLSISGTTLTASGVFQNALLNGVVGDGTTNDTTALNALFTLASTNGQPVFIPGGRTYELGSGSMIVPDGVHVLCGETAVFRRSVALAYSATSDSTFMLQLGNNVSWFGGRLTNTAVYTTSATSNTIAASGSKTFTVAPGLTINNGEQYRFASRANKGNYMEGTVTSYTSATGSITLTMVFSAGSGTFADWDVTIMLNGNGAVLLKNVSKTVVERLSIDGLFYTGFVLHGATAGQVTSRCTLRSCYAEGIQNRSYYLYGNNTFNLFEDCHAFGNLVGDYGFNLNAANSGTSWTISDNCIANCSAVSMLYQGFTAGDICIRNKFINCVANNITQAAGIGFQFVYANGNPPQYNNIVNCVAQSCVGQGFGTFGANYHSFNNCHALSCGVGFKDISSTNNSNDNSYYDILAASCTTGINFGTGSINATATGRSVNNTTNIDTAGSTNPLTSGVRVV